MSSIRSDFIAGGGVRIVADFRDPETDAQLMFGDSVPVFWRRLDVTPPPELQEVAAEQRADGTYAAEIVLPDPGRYGFRVETQTEIPAVAELDITARPSLFD